MKLSKFDIGAEVISIITKGMYPDPKDALREYIQNGVDALAKNMSIKIRQESIVVEDDGHGMDYEILRKAIRVGISDKNPTKSVGFMGIGIYSAFHLCENLTIYSRGKKNIPNRLTMDFGSMKSILTEQKELRLANNLKSEELIDLQSLLESCIHLTEDGELAENEYPSTGTRVEMARIEPEFYTALSGFDEVADYLRNVIPLRFDTVNFTYGQQIEDQITEICTQRNQRFELINLSLQVNSQFEKLYRPYKNIDFNRDNLPLQPKFEPIESDGEFFGVAWGCLNSVRKKIDNKNLRGFILKKQGFSIGRRESMVKYFPRGNTFFDRYSGEVIVVNPKILPNASRNDLEYSPLRSSFFRALTGVADSFDDVANEYQEYSKADDELAITHETIKKEIGSYNEYEEDTEQLVDKIVRLKKIHDNLQGRIDRRGFRPESKVQAESLVGQVKVFEDKVQERIKVLTEDRKRKQTDSSKSKVQIAKDVNDIHVPASQTTKKEYDSLYDLFVDLEYNIDNDLKDAINIIDEQFIQRAAKNRSEYFNLLNVLKDSIQGS